VLGVISIRLSIRFVAYWASAWVCTGYSCEAAFLASSLAAIFDDFGGFLRSTPVFFLFFLDFFLRSSSSDESSDEEDSESSESSLLSSEELSYFFLDFLDFFLSLVLLDSFVLVFDAIAEELVC